MPITLNEAPSTRVPTPAIAQPLQLNGRKWLAYTRPASDDVAVFSPSFVLGYESTVKCTTEDMHEDNQPRKALSKRFEMLATRAHAKRKTLSKIVAKDTPAAKCLFKGVSGSGNSAWTISNAGRYACRTCANTSQPCLIIKDGLLRVLALPPAARALQDAELETDVGWWIATEDRITLRHKAELEGVWEGRLRVPCA